MTNLDDQYPWGIWIGIDVATGVALAAGGFTTAFIAHVLHSERYHVLVRPALLTAMLGYTFVGLGVVRRPGPLLQHLARADAVHVAGQLGPVRGRHVRHAST